MKAVIMICEKFLLHRQFNFLALMDRLLQLLGSQGRYNPVLQERVYLFGSASDEARRVQERVEMAFDGVKVRVATNAIDQIIVEPEVLHLVCCLV